MLNLNIYLNLLTMAAIWTFLISHAAFNILSKYFSKKAVNIRPSHTSWYGLGSTTEWQEAKGPLKSRRIPQCLSANLSGRKLMNHILDQKCHNFLIKRESVNF